MASIKSFAGLPQPDPANRTVEILRSAPMASLQLLFKQPRKIGALFAQELDDLLTSGHVQLIEDRNESRRKKRPQFIKASVGVARSFAFRRRVGVAEKVIELAMEEFHYLLF